MKKLVVIMRGVPGSGKSYHARTLVERHDCERLTGSVSRHGSAGVICSADQYMTDGNGWYSFDPSRLPWAHSKCFNAFLVALSSSAPLIIVDNTNILEWEYKNYQLAASMMGYVVEIVEYRVNTVDEIKECARRNSHGVPVEVVARMALQFEPADNAHVKKIFLRES